MTPRTLALIVPLVPLAVACSSSDAGGEATDAATTSDATTLADAGVSDAPTTSPDASDASIRLDGPATVVGAAIASAYGTPLQGATGDAIPLVVVFTLSDGTTRVADDDEVTWITPITVMAQDPYDAGPSPLPTSGAQPTALYVHNAFRTDQPGVLFITDPGTVVDPKVTVSATLRDGGSLSATVGVLPTPSGDPDAGGVLFGQTLLCNGCHGDTAAGSPPALFSNGGPVLLDGGPVYVLEGQAYTYPAPGLNAAPDSGNLAADPAWTFGLFAMAAQSAVDNQGVALRAPMPAWFGGNNGNGRPLDAQDFANLYAWLQQQTK